MSMVRLTGPLPKHRFSLVVPFLVRWEIASGVLHARRGAISRSFHFRGGRLVAEGSNDPHEHLAQKLYDKGLLTLEQAAQAYAASLERGVSLGKHLLDEKLISEIALTKTLEEKAKDAFFDCYAWTAGSVEFDEGAPESPGGLALDLAELHREALAFHREATEFSERFPDLEVGFYVRPTARPLSPSAVSLLEGAREGATLRALLTAHPAGVRAARRDVLALHHAGVLVPKSTGGSVSRRVLALITEARGCLDRGELERAAQAAALAMENSTAPEAEALFREADRRLAESFLHGWLPLESAVDVSPLPALPPAGLTAADVFLLARVAREGTVRAALENVPLSPVAASKSLKRLAAAGLIRTPTA
jgi:hypothetical protein